MNKKLFSLAVILVATITSANSQTPNFFFEKFYGTDGLDDTHSSSVRTPNGNFVHVGTSDYSSSPLHNVVTKTTYFVWTDNEGIVQNTGSGAANINFVFQNSQTSDWLNTECYSVCAIDDNNVAITGKAYTNTGYEQIFIATIYLPSISVTNFILYDLNQTGDLQQGNKIIAYGENLYVTGFSNISLSSTLNKRFYVIKTNYSLSSITSKFYSHPNATFQPFNLDMEAYSMIYDNQMNNSLIVCGYLYSSLLNQTDMNQLVTYGTIQHKYAFIAQIDKNSLSLQTWKTYGTDQGPLGTEALWFRDVIIEKTTCNGSIGSGYWVVGGAEYGGPSQFAVVKLNSSYSQITYGIHDFSSANQKTTEIYGIDIDCDAVNSGAAYGMCGVYRDNANSFNSGLLLNNWWYSGYLSSTAGTSYGVKTSGYFEEYHSIGVEDISTGFGNHIFRMSGTSNQINGIFTDFKFTRTTTTMNYQACEAGTESCNPIYSLNLMITIPPMLYETAGSETFIDNNPSEQNTREYEFICFDYQEESARLNTTSVAVSSDNPQNIKVFPNPATTNIIFSKQVITIKIYDIMGRIVLEADNIQTDSFNVGTLPNGVYIIDFKTQNNKIHRIKFIKE